MIKKLWFSIMFHRFIMYDKLYNVSFVTGLEFEGTGIWNNIITENQYESASPSIGPTSQSVEVRKLTPFVITNIVPNDGEIQFIINTTGAHSAVINCLAIYEK